MKTDTSNYLPLNDHRSLILNNPKAEPDQMATDWLMDKHMWYIQSMESFQQWTIDTVKNMEQFGKHVKWKS